MFVLLLGTTIFHPALAQRPVYISIDMLESNYKVNAFTLLTAELYGTDDSIQMYNIFIGEEDLLLFSVLPPFDDLGHWEEITIGSTDLTDISTFKETIEQKIKNGARLPKSMSLALVKQIDGRFYASRQCLFEHFRIREYHEALNTPAGTINIARPRISQNEMKAAYAKLFPGATFPSFSNKSALIKDQALIGEYLAKVVHVDGQKAYLFWVFDDWNVVDGPNVHRGIDRFIYAPGLGIVGGSYDFHFAFSNPWQPIPAYKRYRISMDQWQQHILDEKVMLAEELK